MLLILLDKGDRQLDDKTPVGHRVLFKTSIRHLVHAKMSLIFGPVQYHLAWTTYAHGRSGQDHISRTFWCGPNVFWTLWARPNFKDPLAWTKCLMD